MDSTLHPKQQSSRMAIITVILVGSVLLVAIGLRTDVETMISLLPSSIVLLYAISRFIGIISGNAPSLMARSRAWADEHALRDIRGIIR